MHCIHSSTQCVESLCSLCLCPTHLYSMSLQKINHYLYHDGLKTVRLSGCHDSALILESHVLLGTTCVHCIDSTQCVAFLCSLCLCPTHHHSMPLQKINHYLYHDGLKTVRLSGCHDSALILESHVLLGTTCLHCIDSTQCMAFLCSLCLFPTHHHSMPLQKINCYLYHDGLKLLD